MRTGLAAALAVLALAAGAGAATPAWARSANAVCNRVKATLTQVFAGLPAQSAPTYKAKYSQASLKFESALLRDLRAIKAPRNAAGNAALAAVGSYVGEIKAAVAAYKAGDKAKGDRLFAKWTGDKRPQAAFVRAGARLRELTASGCGA